MMRKNKVLCLGFCLLLAASCTSNEQWKLRIEVPGRVGLNLNAYGEVLVTDFLVKKDSGDFDINKEIGDYFSYELGLKLDKKASSREAALSGEDIFNDPQFWKSLFPEHKEAVLFTGTVSYEEEVRKALVKQEKKRFEDPFPAEKTLAKRTFYTLNLNLYLIDNQTGAVIYQKDFKETRAYKNPNQTAYFAFFDLIQEVRDKLFDTLLGGERVQQRYLIAK